MCAQTCLTLCDPMDCARLLCLWDFPGKNTEVDCCLFHEIFPTQGYSPFLLCLLRWQVDSLPPVLLESPDIKY